MDEQARPASASERRNFFISYHSADLAYATAFDASLRAAGLTTYVAAQDDQIDDGALAGALSASDQLLAIVSTFYFSEEAPWSLAERDDRRMRDLRDGTVTLVFSIVEGGADILPSMFGTPRSIAFDGMAPDAAAAELVRQVTAPDAVRERAAIDAARRRQAGHDLPRQLRHALTRLEESVATPEAIRAKKRAMPDDAGPLMQALVAWKRSRRLSRLEHGASRSGA